ncbi:condensation domain-containing protein [Actinophytocola sp.]|uniref:condensation domain-containing protein n=1 Tax=Actinophytocola sp. TaxID=1872138 RepID=UPI003D6B125A
MARHDSASPIWYTANPAQKGLWVLDRVEQLRRTSMIPTIVEFACPVDHSLLVTSVQRVLDRHPSLLSRFRLNIEVKQIEYRTDGEPAVAGFIDAEAENWSEGELDRLLEVLCYTPFDLAAEPPVRAEVIRVDSSRTLLVFSVHHIVCDGWSRTLLMAEIAEIYRAAVEGVEPALSSPPHPSEVVTMLGPDEVAERLPEIVERLRLVPMEVEIPFRRTTDDTSLAGASQAAEFDEELTEALMKAAAEEGCTPFMTAVALLAGTLARTGSQRDFLFAFGWPGRDDPAVADAIGMFMNTVVLRVRLDDTTSWRDLLRESRIAALEAFIDGDVPLDAVTAALRPNRDVIWPPLSAILVNMTEVPDDMVLAPGLVGRLVPLPSLHMKYDLGLFVRLAETADGKRLELSVDYIEALYDRDAIAGFFTDLRHSATDLAHSMEDVVTKPFAAEADLSTAEGRIGLVRSLWQEVLKLDEVGDDVSFFDAGGDSLLLIMLVERMCQTSGRPIRTMDLFRAGTVRGHAELLAAPARKAAPSPAGGTSRDRLLGAVRGGTETQD